VDSNGGRSWWAHLADTRINIELTFLNDEKAFEAAGFTDVKTVLSSGNVLFTAPEASKASLERRAEAAMKHHLGTAFLTIIRPIEALRELLAADPYSAFRIDPGAKGKEATTRTWDTVAKIAR
jgi:hypothetical protein